MTLRDRVVLEIDPIEGADDVGVFELKTDLETTDTGNREFLMAERGQYINQIYDILPDELTRPAVDADFARREGYHLDGGAGSRTTTVEGVRGTEEDLRWGDGSADEESTKTDAVPGDLEAQVDVLDHWLAQTRSDSGGQTRLHIRHHTDGSYSDEAGVFGEPITVAIPEHSISKDDHSEISVTLEATRTAELPDVADALEGVQEAIDEVIAELGEYAPDW